MKALLQSLFNSAIAAVDPAGCIGQYLPAACAGRSLVVGGGKAVPRMLAGVVANYAAPLSGVVVTAYGHRPAGASAPESVQVLEAAHPVPDQASFVAGNRILEIAEQAGVDDRLMVLISGGASALMERPAPGLSLNDLQIVNRQLLSCGADIAEINCVRKQISALKGGRLALAAAPAEVCLFAISDVPGDRFAEIGSGPCSVDTTDRGQALEILQRYESDTPARVLRLLSEPEAPREATDPASFSHVNSAIIARAQDALNAAAGAARRAGFEPVMLGADISAPAAAVAREHAGLVRAHQGRVGRVALISGGETTVRVNNPNGRGGRNSTYLLNLALALEGASGVFAFAADTDGIDGTQENAGAMIGPDTLARAERLGLSAGELLAANRSYDFFAALDDLIVTGPTGTNVNDLRVILVAG